MEGWMFLAIGLPFVSILAVLAAGIAAVWWPTEEARVVASMIVPTAMVASLLVLHFRWRAQLQRQILAERDDRHDLEKAA